MSHTVIIPYYNGSKYIEKALESVVKQTLPPAEIIVVNDGSTAEETQYLHTLQKNYPFRIILKENGGQGSARNAGVFEAKTEYVLFLDQDDFYLPNHNEILVKEIEKYENIDFVVGLPILADENGNIISRNIKSATFNDVFGALGQDLYMLPSASVFKKEKFLSIGGYDPQFTGYEDDDFFIRAWMHGLIGKYIKTHVYIWTQNFSSTSYSPRFAQSRVRFIKKYLEFFKDNPNIYLMRDIFIPRFYDGFVYEVYRALQKNVKNKNIYVDAFSKFVELIITDEEIGKRFKAKVRYQRYLAMKHPKRYVRLYHFVKKSFVGIHLRKLLPM